MSLGIAIGALMYACLFLAIGTWRPRYALAGIFALAPFQNDLSMGGPFRFSIAEINLLLAVPLVLLKTRQITFGATLLPAAAFFLTCVASSAMEWSNSAPATLLQTGLYLIVVVTVFASLAESEDDYRAALKGFVITSTFIAIVVCIARSGYVLGLHKNGTGGTLAAGFLISLELSLSASRRSAKWFYSGAVCVIAAAEVISLSRGAWLASIAGTIVIFLLRRQFKLLLRGGLVIVPVLIIWQTLPSEHKEYAFGLNKDRENIRLRLESIDYAVQTFRAHPLLGAGTGLRKDYDATNILLLTLAENGVAGLFAFFVLHLVLAGSIWKGQRGLPKKSLSFSIVAISGALVVGKLAHGFVDHYWSRGSLSATWASVGMMAKIIQMKRRNRSPHKSFSGDDLRLVSMSSNETKTGAL